MASYCDDLYNIKMDAIYKLSNRQRIELIDYNIKIQNNNKSKCSNESLETQWDVIFLTSDDWGQTLKILREAKYCITAFPADGSCEILQSQEHFSSYVEYRATGIVTLRHYDDSRDDIVSRIAARIYVKDQMSLGQCSSRFERIFGFFSSSFNDQKLKAE